MRKLNRLLLAAVLAVGASARVGAAELTLTGGSLGISIGALPPINFPCVSCPVVLNAPTANGNGNGFIEDASVFTGAIALPTALFTGVALIDGLTIGGLANGEKVIEPLQGAGPRTTKVLRAGGGLGGPGPLTGNAFVNVLSLFNLAVPLGVIGNTGASTMVTAGTLMVAVNGTGWTTGELKIDGITTANTPNATANAPEQINTVTFVGYDNRGPTPNGTGGVVQLISAFHVTTNAAGNLPGLAIQTLTFVPEPGTLLLLGSGVVGLALYGRRRLRK